MKITRLKFATAALFMLFGSSVAIAEEKIEKPEWAGNKIGYEALDPNYVDVDYGPMTVSGSTVVSGFKKITLGKFGLPEMISVKDQKVISGPVELLLKDEKGTIQLSKSNCELKQVGKSFAEGLAKFEANGITVEIKSQFEFDFTIRYLITLTPQKPVTLKQVSLLFPMNLEEEKLCLYYMEEPNKLLSGTDAQQRRVYKTIKPLDSSSIIEQISPGFCSLFWVGNTFYGLSWNFESAQGWSVVKGTELQYDPGTNNMSLNFINKKTILDKAVSFKFFLTPTPHKNMPKNWRSWNYGWRGNTAQKIDRNVINQLIYWSSTWRGGDSNPLWIRNPEQLKKAAMEDKGMNKANYYIPQLDTYLVTWQTQDGKNYVLEDKYLKMLCEKYARMPAYNPPKINIPADAIYFKDMDERNKVLGPDFCPNKNVKSKLEYKDVIFAPEMADHMLWAVNKFVNEYGVGGVYYDGVNPRANYSDWASWTDSEGVKRPFYHFEWQRELLKRVRQVVKKANPNEMVTAHQSGTIPASTLSLCDIQIPGETYFYGYQEPEKRDASKSGDFYYAYIFGDIDSLKTELFHRQWGLPRILLPEVRGKDGKIFPAPKRPTRTMLAYTLHFDMLYWPTFCDVNEIYKWYRIRNEYGFDEAGEYEIEFIPYWENKKFTVNDGNIKVSYYEKSKKPEPYTTTNLDKKYLVIVSNLQFGDAEFKVILPKTEQKMKVRDMQIKQDVAVQDNYFNCKLSAYDFGIYEITETGTGNW